MAAGDVAEATSNGGRLAAGDVADAAADGAEVVIDDVPVVRVPAAADRGADDAGSDPVAAVAADHVVARPADAEGVPLRADEGEVVVQHLHAAAGDAPLRRLARAHEQAERAVN